MFPEADDNTVPPMAAAVEEEVVGGPAISESKMQARVLKLYSKNTTQFSRPLALHKAVSRAGGSTGNWSCYGRRDGP